MVHPFQELEVAILVDRLIVLLGTLALGSGLLLPTVLPEIANISTLVFMAAGLVVLVVRPDSRAVFRQPAVYLPLLACALLMVALFFTAETPLHLLAIFMLAPVLFAGSLAGVLCQLGSRLTPTLVGSMALLGTLGAFLGAAFDVFVRGEERGGWLVNNPIHLADLAVALGFVAVVGVFGDRKWWRLMFLLGPAFALATALLSGSRGPVLAIAPLVFVGTVTVAALLLPKRYLVLAVIGVVCVTLAGTAALIASGLGTRLLTVLDLPRLLASGGIADSSFGERLYMYQSAWNAFWASPWYGFGFINYTVFAAQYAPPGPQWPASQHLHSDIADFAVIGGSLGLASYLLMLAAPVANAYKAYGVWRQPVIYLGLTLPFGYFAMGLTNAVIGILTQTTVYAVVLALISALAVISNAPTASR